jgi:hypothetical protein
MAQRKHGLPQIAPSNLRELLRLLEQGAVVDFSIAALRREGITQHKHVHALLRALSFLDQRSQLTAEIQACRRDAPQLARRLRDGILERCAAYAPQFGDFSFVFHDPSDESVRSRLKQCLAAEPSVNQVICSLMALRQEVRDRLGEAMLRQQTRRRAAPRDLPAVGDAVSPAATATVPSASTQSSPTVDPAEIHSPPSAAQPEAARVLGSAWRVDETRTADGALESLKMHIRTSAGYVTVSAHLENGDFGGIEVARTR